MKVYILKEEDFENLLKSLERDPRLAFGMRIPLSQQAEDIANTMQRFYNYNVHNWIDSVKK